MTRKSTCSAFLSALLVFSASAAEPRKNVRISLPDHTGKLVSLADYSEKPAIVLFFINIVGLGFGRGLFR